MKFQTKKELLKYLGKNEDDRKLVDRMIARGEVRLEGRVYVIDEETNVVKVISDNTSDLDYLNKEYERLEGLLDYSLRRCYGIMKKRGILGSEDGYDVFYEKITEGYEAKKVETPKEEEATNLKSVMQKYNLQKASDII